MNQRMLKAVAVAMAILLAASGFAFAAAPTVDTETADTTTTSDWTDGTTVTNFNASADAESHIEASFDSTNPEIRIIDPATEETIATYGEGDLTQTGTGTGIYYYGVDVSHDELATVPMDANENKSIKVQFVNNTEVDSPDLTNITVFLENTGERAVVRVGSDAASNDDITSLDEEDTWLGLGDAVSRASVENENVGIDGSNTTVFVVYADDDVASAYEDSLGQKYFGYSEYSSGAWIAHQQLSVEDSNYMTYNEEAPEAVSDKDDATFGEYVTVNGEPATKITLGEEDFDGESTVDISTKGNDPYGYTARISGGAFGVTSYEDGWLSNIPGMGDDSDSDE